MLNNIVYFYLDRYFNLKIFVNVSQRQLMSTIKTMDFQLLFSLRIKNIYYVTQTKINSYFLLLKYFYLKYIVLFDTSIQYMNA